ncbi:urea carboxylase-associated protein [Flavobacterium cyanobacteriorum]|uniref:Urea carboxylase-associated protein n=1 Tax=Flavobacterium cyanobacteriorum TaxID=2022802 RepID=A0A255Z8I7_9FLAO|nr:urea carboxylase-associated family protein [Flavobacterium cyanobacteriorum]OYQ37759.1 urea carboxylase-associated protein [Flavobacterium cyanobacteriorum]
MQALNVINPRSGTAFLLKKGQRLKVVDMEGEQVADLMCYNLHDRKEYLSSGRTIDYAGTIRLTKGHSFYSNRSNIMFRITEDTVGLHDFLLTPCSADTFRILYEHKNPHKGCFGNLCEHLAPYGIGPDDIPVTFNIFMNVSIDCEEGKVAVLPPKSTAGDYIVIEAAMDLIVALTACSAEQTNNGSFKPIGYQLLG